MPKVSVIVPVYNVEPYLRRCVDSILNQTFPDFEVILVDDGSPDGCPAICDEYARKDSRVVVIHQENGGLSAARNAGIDWAFTNSDSQWLSLIDSDDWVHPNFLEYLYRAAVEQQVKISVCNVLQTREHAVDFEQKPYHAEMVDAMTFYMENNVWATVAWNKLYHKEVFAHYRYPVGRLHEDEFLTYKLLHAAQKIAYVDCPMYAYYHRPGSIMASYSLKRLDALDAIREQGEFFKTVDETLYKNRLYTLLCAYGVHLKRLHDLPEYKSVYRERRKELRKLIATYKHQLGLSILKTPYAYDGAYPMLMKLHWKIRLPLGKIKRLIMK